MNRVAMGCALAEGGVGLHATTVLDAENVHPTFPQLLNEAESHMFVLVSYKRCSVLGRADVMCQLRMIFEKPLDRMKGVAWYRPTKRRKVMMRAKMIGLMLCALTLVAAIVPGYAGETSVKAWAVWQGQGRFYKATENLALFSGYFEGVMEAENKEGELNAASMICPGMLEVNLADGTQQGWGRCVMVTGTGDRVYAGWSCTGTHLEGCAGSFNVRGGTGKFSSVSGDSTFVVRSTVAEYVATIPEGGVTANFTGQAAWSALKYTIP